MFDFAKIAQITDPIHRDNVFMDEVDKRISDGEFLASEMLSLGVHYGLTDLYRAWFDSTNNAPIRFNRDYEFVFKVLEFDDSILEFSKPGEFWYRGGLKESLLDMRTRQMAGPTKVTIDYWLREFKRTGNPDHHPDLIIPLKIEDGHIRTRNVRLALDLALNYTETMYDKRAKRPLLVEVTQSSMRTNATSDKAGAGGKHATKLSQDRTG